MNRIREGLRKEDGGFSLVELCVVALVLALALAGVAHLSASVMVGTMNSRNKQAAVAFANNQIETIRSTTYADIKMKSGTNPAPPTSFTDDGGVTYTATGATPAPSDGSKVTLLTESAACAGCVVYQPAPIISKGHTFTVKRVILAVDDPADGVAPTDTSPLDYKRVVVDVSSAKPAFTYSAQTIVHDVTNDPISAVQGIQVEVRDPGVTSDSNWDGDATTTNDIVASSDYEWEVTITEAGVFDAPTTEGVYSNFALPTGNYTVIVENTADSKDWYPDGNPTGQTTTSHTFACNVASGQVTTCATKWLQRIECLSGVANTNGRLWVRVQAADTGLPLLGVGLTAAGLEPLTNTLPAGLTLANGDFIYEAAVPIGSYAITASFLGYQPTTQTACVSQQESESPNITFNLALIPPSASTANITVTYTGGGNQTFSVKFIGPETYEQQQSMKKNTPKVFSFSVKPGQYRIEVACMKKNVANLKEAVDSQQITGSSPYTRSFTVAKC